MRYDDAGDARRRRVTAQLGEAVYAALGLMVREYLGADAAEEESLGAEVNESFDAARYLALRGEAGESTAVQPVRETEVSRAGEAAEVFEDAAALREAAAFSEVSRETETVLSVRSARETGGASHSSAYPAAWREMRVEKNASRDALTETPGREASEKGDAFHTALRVSEEIERDARRYDGGVYLQ